MRPGVVADAADPRLRVARRAASTRAGCRRRRTSRALRCASGFGALLGVRARSVVERERDRITVTAAARDDLPPIEHLLERMALCPCRRKAGSTLAGIGRSGAATAAGMKATRTKAASSVLITYGA